MIHESLLVLPDLLKLVRCLARDPRVPRSVRVRLTLLLVYLATPIDVVPDFFAVLGYADDVLITIAVLRSVVRTAGADAVRRRWPGTASGLAAHAHVIRLSDLEPPPDPGVPPSPRDPDRHLS